MCSKIPYRSNCNIFPLRGYFPKTNMRPLLSNLLVRTHALYVNRFWPITFILPDRGHAMEMPFGNENNDDGNNNNNNNNNNKQQAISLLYEINIWVETKEIQRQAARIYNQCSPSLLITKLKLYNFSHTTVKTNLTIYFEKKIKYKIENDTSMSTQSTNVISWWASLTLSKMMSLVRDRSATAMWVLLKTPSFIDSDHPHQSRMFVKEWTERLASVTK